MFQRSSSWQPVRSPPSWHGLLTPHPTTLPTDPYPAIQLCFPSPLPFPDEFSMCLTMYLTQDFLFPFSATPASGPSFFTRSASYPLQLYGFSLLLVEMTSLPNGLAWFPKYRAGLSLLRVPFQSRENRLFCLAIPLPSALPRSVPILHATGHRNFLLTALAP